VLNPAPKPSKHKKKANHYRRDIRVSENILLKVFREDQRFLALERDGGWCCWCLDKKHLLEPAVEVHHVYGRGTWNTKEKYERYECLLSLCRSCHQGFHDHGTITREQLIELLGKVNEISRSTRKRKNRCSL
jgi:hypothetical protein